MISLKRGLDLPITGTPEPTIEDARPSRQVAVLGPDPPKKVSMITHIVLFYQMSGNEFH